MLCVRETVQEAGEQWQKAAEQRAVEEAARRQEAEATHRKAMTHAEERILEQVDDPGRRVERGRVWLRRRLVGDCVVVLMSVRAEDLAIRQGERGALVVASRVPRALRLVALDQAA